MIDVGHHMLSGWSTGCYYETLSSFHVWIFQLILLMKMKSFFGFMWLLHCSWFLFSCKSFLLGLNETSCIQGSFLLLSTLPEVWNFHARPEECIRYMFSLSLFCWFHKLWRVLCLHIVSGLDWNPLHLKVPSYLLARTHEHWYQVWLHYWLQLNVEDIHLLIIVAAVPHAHLYKLLLTVST